jgi:hypothetical protein
MCGNKCYFYLQRLELATLSGHDMIAMVMIVLSKFGSLTTFYFISTKCTAFVSPKLGMYAPEISNTVAWTTNFPLTGPRSIPHSREGAAFPLPVLPSRLCASHIHSFPSLQYLYNKVTKPIDLSASYSSSLADSGCVRWSKASSDPDSNLTVSFPHIR